MNLDQPCQQAEFGAIVGVSQQAISSFVTRGVLEPGATLGQWLQSYCQRLREQAAAQLGDTIDGLDLVQERAALAREQRQGIAIKNAVLRGEFAPINLLAEVLAGASQAVSERLEQLPGLLRKVCPDLPASAMTQVTTAIVGARNEWLRQTAALVIDRPALPDYPEPDGDE